MRTAPLAYSRFCTIPHAFQAPLLSRMQLPARLVADLPDAIAVAHRRIADHYHDKPADHMVYINLLKPRPALIDSNIYLSTYWLIRSLQIERVQRRIETSVRRMLDPTYLKQTAFSLLTLKKVRVSLRRQSDVMMRNAVTSALSFSGKNRMVRVNLLRQPLAFYPRMAYLGARLRFAADTTWETLIDRYV